MTLVAVRAAVAFRAGTKGPFGDEEEASEKDETSWTLSP